MNQNEDTAEKVARATFRIILIACVLYALAVFIFVL